MGDLSSLFLFTAALCADSFAVSFVCGTGKIKIPRSSAWILAFCPAAVLTAASALGAGLAGASLAVLFFLSLFLSFTSVRLGAFLGRKSALALENSRQLPGSRCSLDLSRTGGLILVLLGILKLL